MLEKINSTGCGKKRVIIKREIYQVSDINIITSWTWNYSFKWNRYTVNLWVLQEVSDVKKKLLKTKMSEGERSMKSEYVTTTVVETWEMINCEKTGRSLLKQVVECGLTWRWPLSTGIQSDWAKWKNNTGIWKKNDSELFLAPANLLQIKRKTDLLAPRLAGKYFIHLFSS